MTPVAELDALEVAESVDEVTPKRVALREFNEVVEEVVIRTALRPEVVLLADCTEVAE